MILDTIAEVVAERTGCNVDAVKPDNTFTELGIDSLDTVELLMNLEDRLGLEIELEEPIKTVQELADFIQTRME